MKYGQMNAFKFRIGNKNSLDIRETFETLEGRRFDWTVFLLTNQTLISMIMLMDIHIWIYLFFNTSQGSPMNAEE